MKQVANKNSRLAWFSHQQPLADTRASTNRRFMFNFDFLSLNNDIVKIPVGLQVPFLGFTSTGGILFLFRPAAWGFYTNTATISVPCVVACLGREHNNMNEALRTPVTPFSITDILNRHDVPQQNHNSFATWSQHPTHNHPVSPTYLSLPTYFQGAPPGINHFSCYKAFNASKLPTALPSICAERNTEDNAERTDELVKAQSKLHSGSALRLVMLAS